MYRISKLIATVFLFVVVLISKTYAAGSLLEESTNLRALGDVAKSMDLPIVLVYSAEHCEYCERLDEDVLQPLMRSGELNNSAIIRKFMIDGMGTIVDFNGKNKDAEYYSMFHNVDVTPTIQIVDSNGKELVPKIVGYQSPDMFFAYLLQAITVSKQILRSNIQ